MTENRDGRKRITCTIIWLILLLSFSLGGCAKDADPEEDAAEQPVNEQPVAKEQAEADGSYEAADISEGEQEPLMMPEQEAEKDWAEEMLDQMTLEEKVYQMFFVTPEQLTGVGVVTAAGQTTKECLEKYPVGGIIYFARNIVSREQTCEMIANLQSFSEIPVFTGIDEEGGTVSRVGCNPAMGTTEFPSMLSVGNSGDPNQAYEVGYTIGTECTELGFNLDFAPVADIWSNPDNTAIGSRAFGTDAGVVSDMVEACVRGFQDAGMLCALKHFPGHGNTLTDSHYGAAVTEKTLEELEKEEFLPFKSGIEAGADFVLVGHILTPNVTDASTPATLSKEMISILREDLQFDGVIITDAMNMAAITGSYSSADAAAAAVQAGVDMILMPADFHAAVSGVFQALESGEITEEMIDEHVGRILEAKKNMGWDAE